MGFYQTQAQDKNEEDALKFQKPSTLENPHKIQTFRNNDNSSAASPNQIGIGTLQGSNNVLKITDARSNVEHETSYLNEDSLDQGVLNSGKNRTSGRDE